MEPAGIAKSAARGVVVFVCALLFCITPARAADKPSSPPAPATRPAQPPKTGYLSKVTFTDRSPLSAVKETSARMGWAGKTIKGVVETVLSRGSIVIDNGEFKGKSGNGQFLKRGECVAI